MRKDLKEIKVARRSNTTRASPSATSTRIQTLEGEEVDNPSHYLRNLNNKSGRVQGRKMDYLNRFVDPLQKFEEYDDQEKLPKEVSSTLRENGSKASSSKEPKCEKSEEKEEEEATEQTKQTNGPLESETSRLREQKSEKRNKGAWVSQLLTKIRGRIFSRKGGMIRNQYHSTIKHNEAWGTPKFLTLMEAQVEMKSEFQHMARPRPCYVSTPVQGGTPQAVQASTYREKTLDLSHARAN
ncbi:hypothetical protein JCGZ_01958 [Jatropha curcas]|uniref:Uncharacterized protein n=1 Tax=Jatropha curcas TaxID=180498 RepID=A0A067JTL0_JATCU|nr:hypothetical protein JCGZ_01958 [Jatropha curcas]